MCSHETRKKCILHYIPDSVLSSFDKVTWILIRRADNGPCAPLRSHWGCRLQEIRFHVWLLGQKAPLQHLDCVWDLCVTATGIDGSLSQFFTLSAVLWKFTIVPKRAGAHNCNQSIKFQLDLLSLLQPGADNAKVLRRILSLHGTFTEELDLKILVGLFWRFPAVNIILVAGLIKRWKGRQLWALKLEVNEYKLERGIAPIQNSPAHFFGHAWPFHVGVKIPTDVFSSFIL